MSEDLCGGAALLAHKHSDFRTLRFLDFWNFRHSEDIQTVGISLWTMEFTNQKFRIPEIYRKYVDVRLKSRFFHETWRVSPLEPRMLKNWDEPTNNLLKYISDLTIVNNYFEGVTFPAGKAKKNNKK